MKNSALMLCLILFGCTGLPVDTNYKAFPPTKDAMVVRQARYVSNTAGDLTFEIDLYHLRGYDFGHLVSPIYFFNDYVDSTFFNFPSEGIFKFVSSTTAKSLSATPSTSVILVDESGTYDSVDYYNNRTQGIVKLCQDFTSPSQFMLGGFSKSGALTDQPTDFIQSDFSSYASNQLPLIFDLTKRTGGNSNLYDAVDNAISKLSLTADTKSIIVVAHAKDQASNSSIGSIVAKAIANQIQIHVLFLGDNANGGDLSKLAEITGGLFVSCPSIGELMATFKNLYYVLSGTVDVYRFRINYKVPGNLIISGQEFWFPIQMSDPVYKVKYNPIVVYVKAP
jgi:hypothetical protein